MLGLPCTNEDPDEWRKAGSENRHTHDDEVYSLELLLHVLTFEAHILNLRDCACWIFSIEEGTDHIEYWQVRHY